MKIRTHNMMISLDTDVFLLLVAPQAGGPQQFTHLVRV
jgi:hypothetical protein